jgi:hypothetical protein
MVHFKRCGLTTKKQHDNILNFTTIKHSIMPYLKTSITICFLQFYRFPLLAKQKNTTKKIKKDRIEKKF